MGGTYQSLSLLYGVLDGDRSGKLSHTFATNDGTNFCSSSRLRRLLDSLEGYTVPLQLLDPDIAVRLDVKRVKRAHLDMLVLLRDASRNLQRRRRFNGRRRRRRISSS